MDTLTPILVGVVAVVLPAMALLVAAYFRLVAAHGDLKLATDQFALKAKQNESDLDTLQRRTSAQATQLIQAAFEQQSQDLKRLRDRIDILAEKVDDLQRENASLRIELDGLPAKLITVTAARDAAETKLAEKEKKE